MTAKEKLLLWSQRMVEGYQGLRCDNFTSSWRDGRLFNAIIHRHKYAAPGRKGAGAVGRVARGGSAGRLQTSRDREGGGRSVSADGNPLPAGTSARASRPSHTLPRLLGPPRGSLAPSRLEGRRLSRRGASSPWDSGGRAVVGTGSGALHSVRGGRPAACAGIWAPVGRAASLRARVAGPRACAARAVRGPRCPPPACCSTGHVAHRPMLVDMSKVYRQSNLENLDQAFSVAERDLGVTRLLDPEGACCCPPVLLSLPLAGAASDLPPPQMWTSPSPTRSPSSRTCHPCTTPCPGCLTCRMG